VVEVTPFYGIGLSSNLDGFSVLSSEHTLT